MEMKNMLDRIVMWNPMVLITTGVILIFCSCTAFAWVRWPDGFTGLMGMMADLIGQLLRRILEL